MSNYQGKNNRNQQTFLEIVIVGIFKMIWWLITLPFKGLKFGKGKRGMSLDDKNYIVAKRLEIEKMLGSENIIELKHAVMEADKLVDYAMQSAGYSGTTFADRLRNAQSFINPAVYNNLWQGHKVRNSIAHESEYRISNMELREATNKLLNYLKNI